MNFLENSQSILSDLIAFPTVSSESNLAIIDYIHDHFEAMGAQVQIQKNEEGTKANIFATIGPMIDGGIVLSGHSDVVPITDQNWSHDPFEIIEKDGKLFGRGTCDMKGFIACTMAMATNYSKQTLKRPVHFSFTYDEEIGCLGAKALVNFLESFEVKPKVAIIGEPTSMRVIEGHKGVCEYTADFHGVEGHGSLPDLGVNAVEYAVLYVSKLMEIREKLKARAPSDSRFDPPYSTLNVGAFHGGVAHNVIANRTKVEWDFRPIQKNDQDFVQTEMNEYVEKTLRAQMKAKNPKADIQVQTLGEVVGLEPTDQNEAKDITMALTGSNQAQTVSFGTEAGIFQSLGMSAVVCGPGSIEQAHKADEYIEISQMEACLDMLENLGTRVLFA